MFGKKEDIQLVDCPRDAIQGIPFFIPTAKKVDYLNHLIASGLFSYIDFGSFVSPTAVPQMADTEEIVEKIEKQHGTKLIAIIANEKGAKLGSQYEKIDYLGYPFSISDTFQQRNTKRSTYAAFDTIKQCKEIMAVGKGPELMIYLSMAFGNPYGDVWHTDLVLEWIEKLVNIGIKKFSIADTTAEASPDQVKELFELVQENFDFTELSIHLHSRIESAPLKVEAAYAAGCRIFEGALLGYGGCPFAKDDLVGNIPSELLIGRFKPDRANLAQQLMESFQALINHEL